MKLFQERPLGSFLTASSRQSRLFALAEAHREEKFCRLCHDTDNRSKLIAPCDCNGSMKWVHESCMAEMRRNGDQLVSCAVCGRAYNFVSKAGTLNMILTLLNWLTVISTCLGFPVAFWSGHWPLMIFWSTVPVVNFVMQMEVSIYGDQIVVTDKTSLFEEILQTSVLVIAVFNVLVLFLFYCSLLQWSVDLRRLLPSIASFIVCELIAACVGGFVYIILGSSDIVDEDDLMTYLFLFGLGLWSIIRADMSPAAASDLLLFSSDIVGTEASITKSSSESLCLKN